MKKVVKRIQSVFGYKKAEINIPDDIQEQQKMRNYIDAMLGHKSLVQEDNNFFKMNDKKLEALQEVVKNDLKKAQSSVLRKMDDVYRQTIFKSQVYLQSGVTTVYKAIDMATKDFLNKGIDSITYSNGSKMNIASYAEMCLRTANHRATLLGEGKKRDEFGVHLVVVSAHANTCSKCAPWQGKVLIDDIFSHPSQEYIQEYSKKYPLLSEAVKAGLLHPNCRHSLTTYFEGITNIPKIPDEKEAADTYKAEQKQRGIERDIRKYKRIAAGSCDEGNLKYAEDKVKQLEKELKSFLKLHPELRRAQEREENKIPITNKEDNGLLNQNKYLDIPSETLKHANEGDFTNPKNPKKIKPGEIKLKGGGHGESGIDLLNQKGIEYNIVKKYDNGVRVGNVPKHKMKAKQEGTGQAWFPKSWNEKEIENAAEYVANLKNKSDYIIERKHKDGHVSAIFKYANYKGVTVGVCYEVAKGEITTIFPDETQRMIGGNNND
ncbi:hypothetical protein DFN08_005204 [Clostridium beijerinckii]|nr:hypothetical protein [Clostridium beijerinckii]